MKLYVGNLGDDGNITSSDLRPLFEQFGVVTECECISKADIIEFLTDDCLDNPCPNGKCIDLENDYRCECQPGYSGKNCNQKFGKFGHGFYRVVDGASLL